MAQAIERVGVEAVIRNLPNFTAGMAILRREAATAQAGFLSLSRSSQRSQNLLTSFAGSLRTTGGALRLFGNELNAIGFRISAFIGAPLIAASASAITAGSTFEAELTKIVTLAGVSADQMKVFRQEVLNTSVALGQLPINQAAALYSITSVGVRDTAEAMGILELSSKASAIGLGDVQNVAKLVTSALAVYGRENLSASDAVDQLTVAVREGAFEATEIAGIFGRVIGISEELGVSFAEALSYVAAFSRTGVSTEVAVTSLRAALTAILKPTQQSNAALEAAGITIQDVRDAIADPSVGLARTLIALTTVLGKDDEAIGRVIGTARGLAGVLAVTSELSEDYLEINRQVANSAGEVERQFAVVSDTLAFRANQTRAAMETLKITVSDIFLASIKSTVDQVTESLQRLTQVIQDNPAFVNLAVNIGLVALAIGPVLIAIGTLVNSLGVFIGFAGTVIGIVGTLASTFGALALPVVLVAGAIATLGVLLVTQIKNIRAKMTRSFSELAGNARAWGYALIVEFAKGIVLAAAQVVRALTQIARIITRLLRPKSPPPILPNIDDWGTQTAQTWLDGWLAADFDVFNDIAGRIENLIRSFSVGEGGEAGIISQIIGSRAAIQQAIDQFNQFGFVSDEIINSISQGMGSSTEAVRRYLTALFDVQAATQAVADAQEELNAINQKFSEQLAPLNERLSEIQEVRDEYTRNKRIKQLEDILNDPRASEEAKFFARLELEELDIQKQVRGIEDQRDAEVAAAEAKLKAAEDNLKRLEEELAAREKLVDLQIEQNNLLKELTEALSNVGDAAGGGDLGLDELGGGVDDVLEGIGSWEDAIDAAGSAIDRMTEKELRLEEFLLGPEGEVDPFGLGELEEQVGELDGLLSDIQTNVGGFFSDLEQAIAPELETLQGALDEFSTAWAGAFDAIIEVAGNIPSPQEIAEFFQGLSDLFTKGKLPQGDELSGLDNLLRRIAGIMTFISDGTVNEDQLGGLTAFFRELKKVVDFFKGEGFDGEGPLAGILNTISKLIGLDTLLRQSSIIAFFESLRDTVAPAFSSAGKTIAKVWNESLGPALEDLIRVLSPILSVVLPLGLVATILTTLSIPLALITGLLTGFARAVEFFAKGIGLIVTGGQRVLDGIGKILEGIRLIVSGKTMDDVREGFRKAFQGILDIIVGILAQLFGFVVAIFGAILGFVSGFVEGVIGFFQNLYDTLVGSSIVPDLINGIFTEFFRLLLIPPTILVSFIGLVIGFFTGLLDNLVGEQGIVTSIISGVVDKFDSLSQSIAGEGGVLSGLSSAIGGAVDGIGTVIAAAMDTWIPSIIAKFAQAGADFVAGLIAGMTGASATGEINSAGQNVGEGVNQGVRGGIKANSPSKSAMDIADDYIDGLIMQMINRTPDLARTVRGMTSVMTATPAQVITQSSETSVTFGDVSINNGMDKEVLAATVRRGLTRALQ